MNIELLESRIAPASPNEQVLIDTDIDGDNVVNGDDSVRQQLRLSEVTAAAH